MSSRSPLRRCQHIDVALPTYQHGVATAAHNFQVSLEANRIRLSIRQPNDFHKAVLGKYFCRQELNFFGIALTPAQATLNGQFMRAALDMYEIKWNKAR